MARERTDKVGVLIPTTTAPEEIVPMAKYVEQAGFGEAWVAEDYFFHGGFAAAGAVLEATKEITVGLGIISAVARHPAVAAMEIATTARAHPGRFLAGIGHGVPAWTRQMGLYPAKPLAVYREVVTTVRRLLSGETISQDDGHYYLDAVTLAHPAPDVRLLGGVIGPKSLRLSGEINDGTVLSVLAGPRYVQYAVDKTGEGLTKNRRSDGHLLPTFSLFSVDEDGDKARAAARDVIAFYLSAVGACPLTGVYDANDALVDMISRGGADTVAAEMPSSWLEELAIVGTPSECVGKIEALLDAGSTSVILFPVASSDTRRMLEMAASDILPNLTG